MFVWLLVTRVSVDRQTSTSTRMERLRFCGLLSSAPVVLDLVLVRARPKRDRRKAQRRTIPSGRQPGGRRADDIPLQAVICEQCASEDIEVLYVSPGVQHPAVASAFISSSVCRSIEERRASSSRALTIPVADVERNQPAQGVGDAVLGSIVERSRRTVRSALIVTSRHVTTYSLINLPELPVDYVALRRQATSMTTSVMSFC